jgi:hypothetical protein
VGLTEDRARQLLRAALDVEALPAVGATRYVALLAQMPARTVTGPALPELTYPGYQRVAINGWTEHAPYDYANATDAPIPPNQGPEQQTAWAFAVCDAPAPQAGNVEWIGRLPGLVIYPGDPDPQIPAGTLHVVFPGGE